MIALSNVGGSKMLPYKFTSGAVDVKPDNDITRLLEKAATDKKLTRIEKDRIAQILYGVCGAHNSIYRLHGWAWPMCECLPRILVNFKYDNVFHPYYAPDKTSLKKVMCDIREMIYA